MYKCFLAAVAFLCIFCANAQKSVDIIFLNSTFATDGETLPFWFTANRHGKVKANGPFLNVTELYARQEKTCESSSVKFSWGAHLIAGLGGQNYRQVNQAFAGISYKEWEFKAGMFHDSIRFSGLSTTNGNLVRSQNARPYPLISFSTGKYKIIPFTAEQLSFNFNYSEGILNDNRFVKNTRLHQKSFHLMYQPGSGWNVRVGFEHIVMWGGISASSQIGQMPQDFNSYLRYITGSRGGNSFPDTDRMNVAGNQLGAWQIEADKNIGNTTATIYVNHPFEDFSGVNLRNWPDNLMGIHLLFKKSKFINAIVYEYTNTRQQSIKDSLYAWNDVTQSWGRNENDNYFNHGVYRSGFTYHRQVMASPLFFPVVVDQGISRGIQSTRFYAHHTGAAGYFHPSIKWKGMLTCVKHFGTYSKPYEKPLKQVFFLLELQYSTGEFPFDIGLSAAADASRSHSLNKGILFSVSKKW